MRSDREYLRATDIAALTGMSLRTVRRRIADKVLPSTKLGGARLVAKAALEVVLHENDPTDTEDSDALSMADSLSGKHE
jgi:excisionase family DNA binding protein